MHVEFVEEEGPRRKEAGPVMDFLLNETRYLFARLLHAHLCTGLTFRPAASCWQQLRLESESQGKELKGNHRDLGFSGALSLGRTERHRPRRHSRAEAYPYRRLYGRYLIFEDLAFLDKIPHV